MTEKGTSMSPWTIAAGTTYLVAIGCAFSDQDTAALWVMNLCFCVSVVFTFSAWHQSKHTMIGVMTSWLKACLVLHLLWGQWGFDYEKIDMHLHGNLQIFWTLGPFLIITGLIELSILNRYLTSTTNQA